MSPLPFPSLVQKKDLPGHCCVCSVLWMNYGAYFEVTCVVIEKLERSFKSIQSNLPLLSPQYLKMRKLVQKEKQPAQRDQSVNIRAGPRPVFFPDKSLKIRMKSLHYRNPESTLVFMPQTSNCRFEPCHFYSTTEFLISKVNNFLTEKSQNKTLPDLSHGGMTVHSIQIGFP